MFWTIFFAVISAVVVITIAPFLFVLIISFFSNLKDWLVDFFDKLVCGLVDFFKEDLKTKEVRRTISTEEILRENIPEKYWKYLDWDKAICSIDGTTLRLSTLMEIRKEIDLVKLIHDKDVRDVVLSDLDNINYFDKKKVFRHVQEKMDIELNDVERKLIDSKKRLNELQQNKQNS